MSQFPPAPTAECSTTPFYIAVTVAILFFVIAFYMYMKHDNPFCPAPQEQRQIPIHQPVQGL